MVLPFLLKNGGDCFGWREFQSIKYRFVLRMGYHATTKTLRTSPNWTLIYVPFFKFLNASQFVRNRIATRAESYIFWRRQRRHLLFFQQFCISQIDFTRRPVYLRSQLNYRILQFWHSFERFAVCPESNGYENKVPLHLTYASKAFIDFSTHFKKGLGPTIIFRLLPRCTASTYLSSALKKIATSRTISNKTQEKEAC